MARVEIPVIVVAGAGDAVMSGEILAREVVARLANVRLHIMAGVGHLMPLEAPEEVTTIIRDCARAA